MNTVVLVPWRGGNPYREKNWILVEQHLKLLGWPIVTADCNGLWNRSKAINNAARVAGDWDIAVIGDADTVDDLDGIRRAVDATEQRRGAIVPWAIRHKLSEQGTDIWLKTRELTKDLLDKADKTPRRLDVWNRGGTIVVHRDAWNIAGGFDEGFTEWGYEDVAFREVVSTLAPGKLDQLRCEVIHLWHPTSYSHSAKGRERHVKYLRARGNAKRMAAVLEELRDDHHDQSLETARDR